MNGTTSTPTELGETWVWDAFRSLRLEGRGVHAQLAEHLLRSPTLTQPGDTLDVGSGDGYLWEVGGEPLIGRILVAGVLVLADRDEALLSRALASRDGVRRRVRTERADVMALPFADRSFARAIAVHVLHWCGDRTGVERAAGELARVVAADGHAFVVTVDERVHMREIYELMREARERTLARGASMPEPIPSCSPRVLPFCVGNAQSILGTAFRRVEPVAFEYAHIVEARSPLDGEVGGDEFLTRYARTLPFLREAVARGRVPDAFWDELRELAARAIAQRGALRLSRRDVLFECSEPLTDR